MEPLPPKLSALVIDDEPGVRELCGDVLRNMGFTVRIIETASELTSLLDCTTIDDHLVVCDYNLWPGYLGSAVLQAILQRAPCGSRVPRLVLMSGYGAEDAQHAIASLLDGGIEITFIGKPAIVAPLVGIAQQVLSC